jgi:hypothetical protein
LFASIFATTVSIVIWVTLVFLDTYTTVAIELAVAAVGLQIAGVRTWGEYVRSRREQEREGE